MNWFFNWGIRLGVTKESGRHAGVLVLASCVAFAIALGLHLENPYWAAMPVWVVSQSTRGLMLERGVFRLLGTLVGAAYGLAVLHLGAGPAGLILGLGLGLAGFAVLSHLLRGVHAYGALLGGITTAIVLCPALLEPNHTLDLVLARIACTLIGVVVVTVLMGAFTPESDRQQFYHRVRMLACEALDCAAAAKRGEPMTAREQALLAQISETEAAASLVSAGSVDGYRRLRHVHALIYASIELLAAGRASVAGAGGEELAALSEGLRSSTPGLTPHPRWTVAIDAAAREGHPRLERALTQLMAAELALFTDPASADSRSFGRKATYLAPHGDLRSAIRLGITCGLAAMGVAWAALATGWSTGVMAALGVSIFGLILSAVPHPRKTTLQMSAGVLAGVLAGAGYRLGLQPWLEGGVAVTLSIAPFLLLAGLARGVPSLFVSSIDFVMCFLLSSQAGMSVAPWTKVVNGSLALIAASLLVTLAIWLSPMRNEVRARRRELRRDVVALIAARGRPANEWGPYAARQILRMMLHLCRARQDAPPGPMLALINLGHALTDLHALAQEADLTPRERAQVDAALAGLAQAIDNPSGEAERIEKITTADAAAIPSNRAAPVLALLAESLRGSAPLLKAAD